MADRQREGSGLLVPIVASGKRSGAICFAQSLGFMPARRVAADAQHGCRVPKPSAGFYDFDEYERLVEAAKSLDRRTHLIVLLGGEAGLRCGEMMALEWPDIDLQKRQLCVQRSDWKGHVTIPKGGRLRYVPLTIRLAAALREHRHLRTQRVLCQADGSAVSADIVKHHVERAARRAQISPAALDSAIRLLDGAGATRSFGDILETRKADSAIS